MPDTSLSGRSTRTALSVRKSRDVGIMGSTVMMLQVDTTNALCKDAKTKQMTTNGIQ